MSYRKKHVKNKIHKLKPKKSIVKRRIFWIALLVLAAVFFIFYFFIFSSKFKVKEIEVSGNEKIKSEDLQNFITLRLPREIIAFGNWKIKSKSIFLVDYKKLNKEILENFPAAENVKISRNYFQQLTVEITERKPVGIFCEIMVETLSDECFFVDKRGVIFEKLQNRIDNVFIIRNPQSKPVFLGEEAIAENIIKIILDIEKNLENNFKINIEEAFVQNPARLDIKTTEKWQIYFNLESDMDMQIAKMNLLLSNEIPPESRKNLKYIDFRFKDNVYYK